MLLAKKKKELCLQNEVLIWYWHNCLEKKLFVGRGLTVKMVYLFVTSSDMCELVLNLNLFNTGHITLQTVQRKTWYLFGLFFLTHIRVPDKIIKYALVYI